MRVINECAVTDHGVEHAQYFQGAGTSFTRWEDCYTGCGDSPGEALEDALEMMAQSDVYDTEHMPEGWDEGLLEKKDSTVQPIIAAHCKCESCPHDEDTGKPTCTGDCKCGEESELHHYVTIYVR